MSNPGTTEWTCKCKDCLAEFKYSDSNYQANRARGYSRPERCPECRKQHAKEVGTVGQPYFKVKPLFSGVQHEQLTSVLGRLNHERRDHVPVHTTPPPEPEDKFGIKDDKIIEMFRWFYQAPALQVVVVVGPTGSGKSTYFPYRLVHPPRDYVTLDPTQEGPDPDFVREPNGERKRFSATDVETDLFHRYGQIVVTQPRIQATRNLPGYIAKAMFGSSLGAGFDVGYQYAKNPASDWRSKLRYCTDGSLINWIATGQLDKINTIMIDEAHERSLNIDIIIGLLTQALPRYPRLKLIIASATISADLFINHFNKHLPCRKEQWIEISNDTKDRRKLAEGPDLKRHPDKPGWWLKRADNCELIQFDGKSFQVDPHFLDRPALDYAFLDPTPADKETAEKAQTRLQKLAKEAPSHVADQAIELLKDMYTPWDQLKSGLGIRKTVATDPEGKKCEIVVDLTERRGDILGFLQGEAPIQECCKRVRENSKGLPCRVEALPLFTSLPQAEQDKALLERKPGHHEKLADRVTAAVVERNHTAVLAIHDNVGQFDIVERLIRELVEKKRPDLKDDPSKLVIQRWAREDAEPTSGITLKDVPTGGVLVVVASSRGLALSEVPQPAGDRITLLGRLFALVNQEDEVRRVVISTNVAETSLTIHGILHVVDSGLINQNKWDPETQTTGVRAILQSRAGCKQRWGRAGRLQAGDAWPLYTLDQFGLDDQVDTPLGAPGDARCFPYYSQPEICRSPLEQVLLTAKKAGLETLDVTTFPWLEPPDPEELRRAEKSLIAKGALDEKTGDLTGHGLEISGFQAEAKLANLMVIADRMACAVEMAYVLAVLKVGYSKLFLRRKEWDEETSKRVQEVHGALAESCRDDLDRALKVIAGWSSARAAGQALANLWSWRETWAPFSSRLREKVNQVAPDQLDQFDDFIRSAAALNTDEDLVALRKRYRKKIGPWREWYDECRAEVDRGRRIRAAWAEAQDTWLVVTKCPGWSAAWSAAVEPISIDTLAEELLTGLAGTASGRWLGELPKLLEAIEARTPAKPEEKSLPLDDEVVLDAANGEQEETTDDNDKQLKEAEIAAADARQATITKFVASIEGCLVEFFVERLLHAIGTSPHRVTADRWLSDHGVHTHEGAREAAELQAAVEADPALPVATHRPAATKLVQNVVSLLHVPIRGATVTDVDGRTNQPVTKRDDMVDALWTKLDQYAAGLIKELGGKFRTPAEHSAGRAFVDAVAEATGIEELEALANLAGDRNESWIPRLRAAIATAAGSAWAAANYIDSRALGDKDKVEAISNELIDSLSGHKKEEERRPINFALLDRIRLIFAHAIPEHCYDLSGNTYKPLAGADDPAGVMSGEIDKDSICSSRTPSLIVCASRRALPPRRDGKRVLGLSFVICLDGTGDSPGPALTRDILTGTGGKDIPLAEWSPFAMAAHLAASLPNAEAHTVAESARLLFDQKIPLHSVWKCTLKQDCAGVGQGWWVDLVELVELRKPVKERFRVGQETEVWTDSDSGGDFVQSTFAGEMPDPVFDPESHEADPAATPQGQTVRAADMERELQWLLDEDEAATLLEDETHPDSQPPAPIQPISQSSATVDAIAQHPPGPVRRVFKGRLTGIPVVGGDTAGESVEGIVVGYEQVNDEWVVVLARERREAALARLTANETLTVTVLGPASGSKAGVRVWVPKAEVEVVMVPSDFGFCDDPAVTDELLRVWHEHEHRQREFQFPVTVWELDAPNGIVRLTTFRQIEAHLEACGGVMGVRKARLAAGSLDRTDRVCFVLTESRPELGLVFTAEAAAPQVEDMNPGEEYEVVVCRPFASNRRPSVHRRCKLPPGADKRMVVGKQKTKLRQAKQLTSNERDHLLALCEGVESDQQNIKASLQSVERFRAVVNELYEQSNRLTAMTMTILRVSNEVVQLSAQSDGFLARVVDVNKHGARLEVADPRLSSAANGLGLWLANENCNGTAKSGLSVGDQPLVRAVDDRFNGGDVPVTRVPPTPPDGSLVIGEIKGVANGEFEVALPNLVGRCPSWAMYPWFDFPSRNHAKNGERLPFVVTESESGRNRDVNLDHRQAALFALRCRHPEVVGADSEAWRALIKARLIGQTVTGRVVGVHGHFVDVELAPFVVGSVHVSEFGTTRINPDDLPRLAPLKSLVPVVVIGFKKVDKKVGGQREVFQLSRKQAFLRALESSRGLVISGRIRRSDHEGVIVELAPAITGFCRQPAVGGTGVQGMVCEVYFVSWDKSAEYNQIQLGSCRAPSGTAHKINPAASVDPARLLGLPDRNTLAALLDDSVRQLAAAFAPIRAALAVRDLTSAHERIKTFRLAFPVEHHRINIHAYEQRLALLKELHDLFLDRGLVAEQQGRLVDARDAYDEARWCWPLSDRVPPPSPEPVRASVNQAQVKLSWTKPTLDTEVKYKVTRSAGEEPPVLISELSGYEFTDNAPPIGATLHYAVIAVGRSSEAAADAPPVIIPAEVGDLQVGEADGRVMLSWKAPAAARSIEVWRHPGSPPTRYQGTLLPNVTLKGFEDTDLPNDTTFGYFIVVVYEGAVSAGLGVTAAPTASVRELQQPFAQNVQHDYRKAAQFALRCRHPEVVGAVFRGNFVSLDERDPDHRRVVIEFGPNLRAGCDIARLGIGTNAYLNSALDQLVERVRNGQCPAPTFDFRIVEVPDQYIALSVTETWRARITAGLIGQTVVGRVVGLDWPSVEIELVPFVAGRIHVSEFGTDSIQPHNLPEVAPINSDVTVEVLGFDDEGVLQLSRKRAFRRALETSPGKRQPISGRIQGIVGGGVIVELAAAITGYCHQPDPIYFGGQSMLCEVDFLAWDETAVVTPIQLGNCHLRAGTASKLEPMASADPARQVGLPARTDLASLMEDSVRQLASAVAAIRTALEAGKPITAQERIKDFRRAFPLEHPGLSVYEQWMAALLNAPGIGANQSTSNKVPKDLGSLDDRMWQ
jgi:HrpA-like RNA helicase/predicted RNA-binding protein with RPS1 domain